MKKLIFDTETTGLARFDLASNHHLQPRAISIAALLLDDNVDIKENNELKIGLDGHIEVLVCLIKPIGFNIPFQVSQIHGITQEKAFTEGLPCKWVFDKFQELVDKADIIIGHNVKFDIVVAEREGINFKGKLTYCTMLNSTNILKIKKKHGYKWPKLAECVKYFFNEDLEGAHDALNDVRACARVYEKLQELEKEGFYSDAQAPAPLSFFSEPCPLYKPSAYLPYNKEHEEA